MDKVKQKALTFDDVLLLPKYSDFLPSEASTQTKLTKNIDYIYHLAGVSDINKVKKMPNQTIKDNIILTANLLEATRINKIKRFIFASSIYAHGKSGNLYTTSKLAAENIIKNYSLLYKIKYTILRYATAYGTNNRGVDVVSLFVKKAIKNKKGRKITVEVDTLEQFRKINGLKFDTVLFDNMSIKNLKAGVKLAKNRYETEASGGVSLKNIKKIAETGIDRVSIGEITHSVRALDFKLEI